MRRASCSAIQQTTGDRVISLGKPLPAPIRSWVFGDVEMIVRLTVAIFPDARKRGAPSSSPALQRLKGLMPSQSDFGERWNRVVTFTTRAPARLPDRLPV